MDDSGGEKHEDGGNSGIGESKEPKVSIDNDADDHQESDRLHHESTVESTSGTNTDNTTKRDRFDRFASLVLLLIVSAYCMLHIGYWIFSIDGALYN